MNGRGFSTWYTGATNSNCEIWMLPPPWPFKASTEIPAV